VTKRDWLTLFIALEGAPDGLDPVRIQKGMFLFAMEAEVPAREKYGFKAYDYGPMSAAIYSDLDALVRSGVAIREDVEGKRWSRFRATDVGHNAGTRAIVQAQLGGQLAAAQALHAIKRRVASLPFDELLRSVYAKYPEYAENSVFRRSA
jgi:uncharacterized protein YwgA